MSKKIANLIVDKRIIISIIMLVIAIFCGVLALKVDINSDMTKYLASKSNMKQGLDIMESDFDSKDSSGIRVMFTNLNDYQKETIKKELADIKYVDSVDYDAESTDYNKDNHTLYILNADYDYDSAKEHSIENYLSDNFNDYEMVYQNNDTQQTTLPSVVLVMAIIVMIVILFVMSESWLEPILIMSVIGIAVVINLGTNYFLGYVSNMTMSIAPILQLALSMDYSIILMNRYRQEKHNYSDKYQAMKSALSNSFSSIASSSITTVVGLMMLIFLSFKIGMELGIVLSKGVFISMVCVFALLPMLVLLCDKGIQNTQKKTPHFNMRGLGNFSYKAKHIIPLLFAVVLVVSFIFQNLTPITFADGSEDKVANVFAKDNTTVLVYNNDDEGNIKALINKLENSDNSHIKSVTGYSNTLGKSLQQKKCQIKFLK